MNSLKTAIGRDEISIFASGQENICGIDIGGANLKYATADGRAHAEAFAMWREADQLAAKLRHSLNDLLESPGEAYLGITMTAELADCFATRREGVAFILDQVEQACGESIKYVYAVDGTWLNPRQAQLDPWVVAASNWHALAKWIANLLTTHSRDSSNTPLYESAAKPGFSERGLVVDIGSTTVDIVPFFSGHLLTNARTDRQRMQKRQLLYTGIERTPVATILGSVELEHEDCPLMKERFADSNDVYLVLGQVPEQADNLDTADGRSRTILNAAARLARMVGEDLETLPMATVTSIAHQIAAKQLSHIIDGVSENLRKLAQSDQHAQAQAYSLVFSGHGRFLSQAIVEGCPEFPLVPLQLEDLLGKSISRCAPAFSVARLLQAHLGRACYD